MRNTLDVADLAQFSGEHLHYEFSMLFVSAYIAGRFDEEVGAAVSQDARWALKNAAIESFAIHLRNCIDFFYPTVTKDDDVIADDFFTEGRPTSFPEIIPALTEARVRAHKQLSHLTTKRIYGSGPEKAWDFGGLSREIHKLLREFISHADSTKLNGRLKEML